MPTNPKQIPELTAITAPTAGQETDIETVVAKQSTYATYKMTLAQIFTFATVSGAIKTALDNLSTLISGNTTSINNLSTNKLDKSGALRTGLTAKRVLIVDSSGNETYLSGTSPQQIWFDGSGNPTTITPSVDINGLSSAATVLDTDEYIQYNQTAVGNRKVTGKTLRKVAKKFGGTGADGAVTWSSNITITGSNNTYIQKNYTSWAAASGGAKTLSITPTNCILHIKISGDADFTSWTFDLAGKGGQGSASVVRSSTAGASGSDGLSMFHTVDWAPAPREYDGTNFLARQWEGGNSQLLGYRYTPIIDTSAWYGITTTTPYFFVEKSPRVSVASMAYAWIKGVSCGSGWSGGSSASPWDTGWTGGNGGGAIIIEVAWNVTFSTTAVNVNGTGGTAFTPGYTSIYWGGGGGWTALIIYWGTKTGNPTYNVAGGTQWGGNAGKNGDSATLSLDELP